MELQERNFITLLSAAVQPGKIPEPQDPDYPHILRLAESHAVTGLLYPALKKVLPSGEALLTSLKKQSFSSAAREGIQEKELARIFAACQEAGIPILPLKGCVIKALYPYPELRLMSDADLLIREGDGRKMRSLMEGLGFRFRKVDAGDTDVYVSPLSMNYEIHLDLEGEGFSPASRRFLKRLPDLAHAVREGSCILELPPEEHYVYILCHFIKHFIYGGVGVRQLADLFLCRHRWDLRWERVRSLLEELELEAFHSSLEALWGHWFLGEEATDLTEELGTYILKSGVFGNEEQRAADRLLSQNKEKSYVLSRLFPPYKTMKAYFPILKKLPILLPFAWVWRAIRAVLFRRGKLNTELKALSGRDEGQLDHRRRFYHQCGLSVYDQSTQ